MATLPEMPNETEYKLVNAYDEQVRLCVWQTMHQMDMCTCEKCFLDACAMVYNKGYTKFTTTREGELLSQASRMNHGSHADLLVAVAAALNLVKQSPKH